MIWILHFSLNNLVLVSFWTNLTLWLIKLQILWNYWRIFHKTQWKVLLKAFNKLLLKYSICIMNLYSWMTLLQFFLCTMLELLFWIFPWNLMKILIDWLIDWLIIFLTALTEHIFKPNIWHYCIIKTLLPSFWNKYHSWSLQIKWHCEQSCVTVTYICFRLQNEVLLLYCKKEKEGTVKMGPNSSIFI